MKKARRIFSFGLAVGALLAVGGVQLAWADFQWSDDFSTNTTANYNTRAWPYYANSAGATTSIIYDAPNQRAILQAVGGYAVNVMEGNGESPIPAGSDFTFSADLSILSEYNGFLYLGDNRPILPAGARERGCASTSVLIQRTTATSSGTRVEQMLPRPTVCLFPN
jgi:hypothetical protein